tara:strand:- start:1761 stop:2684 length:924 start_codon:yes stop_codon:yes gene_type:complete
MVTLGLPAYNSDQCIGTAIESILCQTFSDFELIVSDDASTDYTYKVCREYQEKDNRFFFIRNKKNIGAINNFNIVLNKARGKYFAWVSDHDIWDPDWLHELVHVLERNPSVVLTYPIEENIDAFGEIFESSCHKKFETHGIERRERIKALYLRGEGYGAKACGLFRREALEKAGIYRNYLMPDVLLLWEISMYGSLKFVPKKLWYRRKTKARFSIERQKQMCFSRPPWYISLPWPITNSVSLLWTTVLNTNVGSFSHRIDGLILTFLFLAKHFKLLAKPNHYNIKGKRVTVPSKFLNKFADIIVKHL